MWLNAKHTLLKKQKKQNTSTLLLTITCDDLIIFYACYCFQPLSFWCFLPVPDVTIIFSLLLSYTPYVEKVKLFDYI